MRTEAERKRSADLGCTFLSGAGLMCIALTAMFGAKGFGWAVGVFGVILMLSVAFDGDTP